jgi:hypothetical protein
MSRWRLIIIGSAFGVALVLGLVVVLGSLFKPTTVKPASVDPVDGWHNYSDTVDGFAIRFPPAWQIATCADEDDGSTTVMLAPTAAGVGICDTQGGEGQITGFAVYDDGSSYRLDPSLYDGIITTRLTVDGVTGVRLAGVRNNQKVYDAVAGARVVRYIFNNPSGQQSYVFTYRQDPSGNKSTNVLSDFDKIIQTTLTFDRSNP